MQRHRRGAGACSGRTPGRAGGLESGTGFLTWSALGGAGPRTDRSPCSGTDVRLVRRSSIRATAAINHQGRPGTRTPSVMPTTPRRIKFTPQPGTVRRRRPPRPRDGAAAATLDRDRAESLKRFEFVPGAMSTDHSKPPISSNSRESSVAFSCFQLQTRFFLSFSSLQPPLLLLLICWISGRLTAPGVVPDRRAAIAAARPTTASRSWPRICSRFEETKWQCRGWVPHPGTNRADRRGSPPMVDKGTVSALDTNQITTTELTGPHATPKTPGPQTTSNSPPVEALYPPQGPYSPGGKPRGR